MSKKIDRGASARGGADGDVLEVPTRRARRLALRPERVLLADHAAVVAVLALRAAVGAQENNGKNEQLKEGLGARPVDVQREAIRAAAQQHSLNLACKPAIRGPVAL